MTTRHLSYYFEVDIASAKVPHEYHGYGFVRSPDHAKVAHVGWISAHCSAVGAE